MKKALKGTCRGELGDGLVTDLIKDASVSYLAKYLINVQNAIRVKEFPEPRKIPPLPSLKM